MNSRTIAEGICFDEHTNIEYDEEVFELAKAHLEALDKLEAAEKQLAEAEQEKTLTEDNFTQTYNEQGAKLKAAEQDRVCTGCGWRGNKPIRESALACCPDNDYRGGIYWAERAEAAEQEIEWLRDIERWARNVVDFAKDESPSWKQELNPFLRASIDELENALGEITNERLVHRSIYPDRGNRNNA